MTENEISYIVRGAIFDVYNHFGPGLLENVYKQAMFMDLLNKNVPAAKEVAIPATYLEKDLGMGYRADLIVENKVIVEIKSIETLADVHKKQLLTYLKLAKLKLGILVNFNTDDLKKSIVRVVNDL